MEDVFFCTIVEYGKAMVIRLTLGHSFVILCLKAMKKIQLSDHFSYNRLLRFTAPCVVMMVFTSIYGIVDGFFVSNFAGKTPFAAVNLIFPFLMILGTVGFMFGAGGNALISKTLGEGDRDKANRLFSLLIYVTLALSLVMTGLGYAILRPVAVALGAEGELLENCVVYGRIYLLGLPAFIFQYEFQSLFSTAETPRFGLVVTLASGLANMLLDGIFVGVAQWGIAGAAWATVISQVIGGGLPLLYYALPNKSLLRIGRASWDGKALLKICANGSSELLSNVSMSVVSMFYNAQLIRFAGENGVAAYGVLMYVGYVFFSVFMGYSVGVAPVVGFHYGAKNRVELRNLLGKSMLVIGVASVCMCALAEGLSLPFAKLFVGYDPELLRLTERAFRFYSISFLFMGTAVFGSAFFTALNNGPVSATISFLRTCVFQIAAVLLLPLWLGIDGVWSSLVVSEAVAMVITFSFLWAKRKRYGYTIETVEPTN